MRVLVVTNMYPSPARPALGRFVYDQVQALQDLPGLELEVFAFGPGVGEASGGPGSGDGGAGGMGMYPRAARELRRRYRGVRFDVVHAHFGLSAWPALAVRARARSVTLHGTDLAHPRSRAITLAALPLLDLVGVVSDELAGRVPRWVRARAGVEVLPCGVDLGRFRPIPRAAARAELGLDPDGRRLLFPADPARPEKRHDLAQAVAGEVPLLSLVGVDPERVPLYVNAADAVLVTSEREGFGLATLEALACDVPVLATPHGVAPEALAGVAGTLCEPFSASGWREFVETVLADSDPRIEGRARAERWSARAMAERVADTWRALAVDGVEGA